MAWTAQRAEGRPGRLTERLMRSWMERITSYGFRRIPRARGRAGVQRGGAVRANPISPILHWKFNGELLIAANGKTISVAYDREIVRMLGRVSQGNVCAPAQLTRVGSGKAGCAPRRAARRSLEFLMEERALVRV